MREAAVGLIIDSINLLDHIISSGQINLSTKNSEYESLDSQMKIRLLINRSLK